MAKVERVCEQCGTEFSVSPCYVKRGGARFCSPECWHAFSGKNRVKKICEVCEKEFTISRADDNKNYDCGRFCSRKCMGVSYETERQGSGTWSYGKKFSEDHRQKMSDAQMGEKNHMWSGGYGKPRSNCYYKLWVKDVLRRDKVCQHCGKDNDLVAHHIHSFKDYMTLRYEELNGMAVCRDCHYVIHYGDNFYSAEKVMALCHA